MANPQPNDAHIRIAHSINEAIMMRDFSKRQRKILDLILRLSWGCGKKTATIPHQSDFEAVGIYKSDIKKELDWLEVSGIIGRDGSSYWFKKDFDSWQISRVHNFQPQKVSELLTLNLREVSKTLTDNGDDVSKTLTKGLVKHEPESKYNTNNATHELASPKEKKEILKKDGSIKEIYTPYSPPLEKGDISEDLNFIEQEPIARQIWGDVLAELEGQISKANYRTWLSKTAGLALNEDSFLVGAPNTFNCEYLEHNQKNLIEKALLACIGRPVQAVFRVRNGDMPEENADEEDSSD